MRSNNILKDASISTLGVGITTILSAIQAIVVAKILGPTTYGEFTVYRLILSYTVFCDIGVLWAMVREVSYYRGQHNFEKIVSTRNVAFSINIFSTFIICIPVLFYLLFSKNSIQDGRDDIGIILIVGAIIIAQGLFVFSRNYMVAEKRFTERTVFIVIFPLFNLIFVLLLGNKLNLQSALFAMLIAYILSLIYAFYKKLFWVNISFDRQISKRLFGMGLPIFGNGLLSILTNSLDRVMILYFLPITQLGFYGIAAMIKTMIDNVYRTIFLTIFPNLSEKYGETNNAESIKHYVWFPVIVGSYLAPFIFGGIILITPALIKIVLPQYTLGILATQIVVASSFFSFIQVGLINYFITVNKLYRTYPHRIGSLVVCAILSYAAIVNDWGIEGVALSYLLATALLSSLLVWEFYHHYKAKRLERVGRLFKLYLPFGCMCLTLYIVSLINPVNTRTSLGIVSNTFLQLCVFLLLNSPLIIWLNQRHHLF